MRRPVASPSEGRCFAGIGIGCVEGVTAARGQWRGRLMDGVWDGPRPSGLDVVLVSGLTEQIRKTSR